MNDDNDLLIKELDMHYRTILHVQYRTISDLQNMIEKQQKHIENLNDMFRGILETIETLAGKG
jgi:hypothetical protein